jgi:hypothetical protein
MLNPHLRIIVVSALLGGAFLPQKGQADEMPPPVASTSVSSRVLVGNGVAAVGVVLDFAKILAFDLPARTIIIGNPGIVDGTLSDEYTMVLTGKSVGTTNMIVLGEAGQEIAHFTVNVVANSSQLTTVHHGITQQIFTCAGPCQPLAPAPAANSK